MDLRDQRAFFLGVIALPSAEVTALALGLAREITGRARLSSCIERTGRVPHVILFQGLFPSAQLERITDRPLQYPLSFQMDGLELRPNGNVFWNVVPTEALMQTHCHLHRVLHPLTNGRLLERFQLMADNLALPEEEREHIRRYGSVLAGPTFTPHITLGCAMSPERAKEVLQEIHPAPHQSFDVTELHFALLHDDGSVYHILQF